MLENFFNYPYKEGYTRWFEDDKCYYIPTEKMKELLLEDLKSITFKKIIKT